MGSSLGGYLAALYAARHPEVSRVVLLAPAFGFARHWAERMGATAVEAWRATGGIEVFHYGENRQRRLSYALLGDGLRYEDYPDFRQPALIFHGAQDDVVPARYSAEFAATHPNARLETLESGHELLNVLEYMAPKVCEFLAGE
jgi:pimeloyl-ACP methyl ester carboxylesterase